MKKIIILGLVLLMVVVFATSIFGKAEKSDLRDNISTENINNIEGKTPRPLGDVVGFVILNNPDPEDEEDDECNLVVVVSLKNGEPDTDYNIFLEYWVGNNREHVYIIGGSYGTYDSYNDPLHTNENGKGNFELRLVTGDLECIAHDASNDFPSGPGELQILVTETAKWTDFLSTAVEVTIKEEE